METESGNQDRILKLLDSIEQDVRTVKQLIFGTESVVSNAESGHFAAINQEENGTSIEGIFDGEKMIDYEGKGYQISPNYASKSKLVEGDPIKLYITNDGKFYYKQIGPIPRRTIPATLRSEGSHYILEGDDSKVYNVLTASVTYYMSMYNVRPNDRVMIMIPAEGDAHWAVIDNLLGQGEEGEEGVSMGGSDSEK